MPQKVYFSDFGLDAEGYEQIGATYYEFDILIDALEPGADIAIPVGTYEISTSEYAPGYVTRGMYYKYDEDSYEIAESEMAWGGHLTINEGCVTSRTMASYIMTAVKIMT